MHSTRHERESGRQALHVEALALIASFLSPMLGPFAFGPAIALGHVARWCWGRSAFDNRGGPTLLALIVGYSFFASAILTSFIFCCYSLFAGDGLSIGAIVALYWVLGGTGVAISLVAYMIAIESRAILNISTIAVLVMVTLCLASMSILRSRERARQLQVMDNLRKLGFEMHAKMQFDPRGTRGLGIQETSNGAMRTKLNPLESGD